jgi:hypothetical protein
MNAAISRRALGANAHGCKIAPHRIDQATKWGKRRYLVMDTLLNPAKQEAAA